MHTINEIPNNTMLCRQDRLPDGATKLMNAAMEGNLAQVKENLDQLGMKDTKFGRTALMLAAENGYPECVQLLLSETGMRDNKGNTALMRAANNGKEQCIKLLLSETGMKNNDGNTAMEFSISRIEYVRNLACIWNQSDSMAEDLKPYKNSLEQLLIPQEINCLNSRDFNYILDYIKQRLIKQIEPKQLTNMLFNANLLINSSNGTEYKRQLKNMLENIKSFKQYLIDNSIMMAEIRRLKQSTNKQPLQKMAQSVKLPIKFREGIISGSKVTQELEASVDTKLQQNNIKALQQQSQNFNVALQKCYTKLSTVSLTIE